MTQKIQTLPGLKITLLEKSSKGISWSEIAKELYPDEDFRIWRSILWRIAKDDYEPKNNKLRKRLGLPFIKTITACPDCNEIHLSGCPDAEMPTRGKTAIVPVCGRCGIVHTTKRCTSSNNKKRNRLSINLDDPGSAGKSIRKHMDSEKVNDLIVVLMEEMLREG
jgi:hypothetical protein